MPAFDYVCIDARGKRVRGVEEADSVRVLRQQLRDSGWVPVEIHQAAAQQRQEASLSWLKQRIGAWDLALLTRQLATLVQASIPLEEALRALAKQSVKPQVQSVLTAIRARVLEGYTLAQSLGEFPRTFPDLYRATVEAGEKSGHLDLVLEQLADYTESRFETRKKIQHALIYPALLTTMSVLIITALLTWVVPDIVRVFDNSHQQLPLLTRGLIATSDLFKHWLWLMVLAVAGGAYAFQRALQNPAFRFRYHTWLLRLPLIGGLIRDANTARLAATLSILSRSGVPLVEGLRICVEVMNNLCLKQAVRSAAISVTEGGSLARALEQSQQFPPMMIQMISSGEQSGELENMLTRAATMQERELASLITTLVGLFEPLMLLMMAGVVLIIVLAIMLPIVSMNNLVH